MHMELCNKLDTMWDSDWKAISLRKRFCEFAFSSLKDAKSWTFVGTKDFVPISMKFTEA